MLFVAKIKKAKDLAGFGESKFTRMSYITLWLLRMG
jgi:hypothetical protein